MQELDLQPSELSPEPEAAPPTATAPAYLSPPDLSLLTIGIGVAILTALTVLVCLRMPLPKFFARPGEDRSLIEPTNPQVHALYQQAVNGNADAMFTLGSLYLEGRAVMQDDAIAAKWLRKGADAGNGLAMNALGIIRLTGRGGQARDNAEAFRWFLAAAEKGVPQAMLQTGASYAMGRGTAIDRPQAIGWLRRAAQSTDENVRRAAADALRQLGA